MEMSVNTREEMELISSLNVKVIPAANWNPNFWLLFDKIVCDQTGHLICKNGQTLSLLHRGEHSLKLEKTISWATIRNDSSELSDIAFSNNRLYSLSVCDKVWKLAVIDETTFDIIQDIPTQRAIGSGPARWFLAGNDTQLACLRHTGDKIDKVSIFEQNVLTKQMALKIACSPFSMKCSLTKSELVVQTGAYSLEVVNLKSDSAVYSASMTAESALISFVLFERFLFTTSGQQMNFTIKKIKQNSVTDCGICRSQLAQKLFLELIMGTKRKTLSCNLQEIVNAIAAIREENITITNNYPGYLQTDLIEPFPKTPV